MEHPTAIRPEDHAVFNAQKMGKATLFESDRVMVGLNAFEPGQEHALHAHAGMDKVYQVLTGSGVFLLEDQEMRLSVRYWEGAVDVAGKRDQLPVKGRGYVELTGYAKE